VTYGQHLRDRQLPNPGRPIWHNEKERDAAGEARQLVRLLGIKSGMTIADVGAGSGYYVERLSPIVGAHGRVPRQSSPLKGDASRTRPALNLIAQAIDRYWKK
jgi:predicted methyltransferase